MGIGASRATITASTDVVTQYDNQPASQADRPRSDRARQQAQSFPLQGLSGTQRRHAAVTVAAGLMPSTSISRVSPEQREMNQLRYGASHPEYGQLAIEQSHKSASESKVTFRLHLHTPDGRDVTVTQEMTAENENPTYMNRSTFGYDVVELPEAMQGKAIGYFVQYAAARAATRLGARRVTVDAVSNERMKVLCRKIGMANKGAIDESCYSGDPTEVARRSMAKLTVHGWSIDSE